MEAKTKETIKEYVSTVSDGYCVPQENALFLVNENIFKDSAHHY